MNNMVRAIDIGLFPAQGELPEMALRLLHAPRSTEAVAVTNGTETAIIRLFSTPADSLVEDLPSAGSWTRYEVRAGVQRDPVGATPAFVLSEEEAFQDRVEDHAYEKWVDEVWGPGVTALPAYRAALLLRGTAGARRGKYASIGWFTNAPARDQLLRALSEDYPSELAGYRKLIDEAFGTYLDRGRRRFLSLQTVPPS